MAALLFSLYSHFCRQAVFVIVDCRSCAALQQKEQEKKTFRRGGADKGDIIEGVSASTLKCPSKLYN